MRTKRQSCRIQGVQPSQSAIQQEPAVPYASMAHEASRRSEQAASNKAKNKYKRQARSKKNIEQGYARNAREQGGEIAMNKIFTAQEHVIRAMTHSVK